jgi:hypothetical protein
VHTLWHLLQQCLREFGVGWVLGQIDRNKELLCFRINIADIDTTFVREEYPITLRQDKISFLLCGVHLATMMPA